VQKHAVRPWVGLALTILAFSGASAYATPAEVKILVAPADIPRALQRLDLTPQTSKHGDIYFFDQKHLQNLEQGLLLRFRERSDDTDSTVKLRPADPDALDRDWFKLSGFKCENDISGTRGALSCSLTSPQRSEEIDEFLRGNRSLNKLFDKEQEKFIRLILGKDIHWESLRALGPVTSSTWKAQTPTISQFNVELWTLPDRTRFLELSIKIKDDAKPNVMRARAALLQILADHGLHEAKLQKSKTQIALEFFARPN